MSGCGYSRRSGCRSPTLAPTPIADTGEANVGIFGFRRLDPQVRAIGIGSELVAIEPFET